MKKMILLFLLIPTLLLSGCGNKADNSGLTGLTFERGNGSVGGDRLYIAMTDTQITELHYIPAGSSQPQTLTQLPITPDQWQSITRELEKLTLERRKVGVLEKLFPKQDGGDYRRLTLTYGEQEIAYLWPVDGQPLEAAVEQLVAEVMP